MSGAEDSKNEKGKEAPKAKPKAVPKGVGKSPVWQYFSEPVMATSGKNEGKLVTTCAIPVGDNAICGVQLVYNHSTTCLSNHLHLVHSAYIAKVHSERERD